MGRLLGINVVLHWHRNGDRHARYRKCDHYYLSRPLPAMWISHVLQMILLTTSSRSDYNTNKGTGYIPCLFLFVHFNEMIMLFLLFRISDKKYIHTSSVHRQQRF